MSENREVWVKIRASEVGAGRVARQGPLRWAIAFGSGTPVGWPGADLDGRAHGA